MAASPALFEYIATGTDPHAAFSRDVAPHLGSGWALRHVAIPRDLSFGDFMDLVTDEQRLQDSWLRIPNRTDLLRQHEASLAALPADIREAVIAASRYDDLEHVCCWTELEGAAADLERAARSVSDPGVRVYLFWGVRQAT